MFDHWCEGCAWKLSTLHIDRLQIHCTAIIGRKFTTCNHSNWLAYFVVFTPNKKEDESSWSKNDSWGGDFSLKMPRYKEHCAPSHCNRLCGFVCLLALAFVLLVCHLSQVSLQKWAICEWRKKEKLSSGRWHRNPKIWNEINGKMSLFTCQILAKGINCSLKRVLPEFLCNQIKIQTLSWRTNDFIATHVHPE